MSTFTIDKQFDFCYGHRVHNQHLSVDHSMDGLCKCRHLHGHNGKLKVSLTSNFLERGMVTDFKNLECVKVLVDDILDHKFIIDIEDPLFQDIVAWGGLRIREDEDLVWDDYGFGKISDEYIAEVMSYKGELDLTDEYLQALKDKLEGFVIVKFVPTSENLCQHIAKVVEKRLETLTKDSGGRQLRVNSVDFWETPKSHCHFKL